jgi:hypothetical protein
MKDRCDLCNVERGPLFRALNYTLGVLEQLFVWMRAI